VGRSKPPFFNGEGGGDTKYNQGQNLGEEKVWKKTEKKKEKMKKTIPKEREGNC